MFTITVGDPQKVGDPISAHIVYTVTTKTNHPAFKKDSFSVLRRYSDFLWLYETLVSNNPGIIVPPVPEKVALGRFEGSFVESRRLALNKCIQKIANHAKLANDLDFIFFLESDTFSLDIKHRRAESSTGGFLASLGSSISGSKFHETDEWFDKKKTYLDTLEAQLRSLVKAIEAVAKQRTEVITATQEFADTIAALAASDLSKHLSESMKVLAQVETQAKELHDSQARDDLVLLTGTVDEYIRLITSVRLAFQSRTKTYHNMKLTESERLRVRNANEKIIRQHTVDRQSMVPLQREIEQVELKAQEARTKFEEVTRLCKAEVDRFERERINDFKISLERFLDGMLRRQNEIIDSWDGYQKLLLKSTDLNNEAPTAA
ncbi:Vps5 C terminal like-domain-containing protein [Cantharellus anzutake]|uniref:Vps5 C terminal like-domain-containing protein n=1 Tax=Cantharellus anzutake TaxID=1750568 RepID=UPI001906C32C|nr:Vps5 C terminal like-domain-containing protein [Cantharellus anzutake]KAF8327186.1 Vps5 C terminal like-domain-containing protein [Cantharellus anzutake]